MMGKYVEVTAFHEVAKVLNGQIDCKEFPVSGLCGVEVSSDRLPSLSNLLLEDSSNCSIRGVSHDAGWSMWLGVG